MSETQKAEYFRCQESEKDYCLKCWEEFTTLTEEEQDVFDPERNNYKRKPYKKEYSFICNETGKIYKSYIEASKELGIHKDTIYRLLNDKPKTSRIKYTFKYI